MVCLSGSVESHCISTARWFQIVEISHASDALILLIHLNLHEDVAYCFGDRVSTVSRNFHCVLDILSVYTTGFIKWPDRETLCLAMPRTELLYGSMPLQVGMYK